MMEIFARQYSWAEKPAIVYRLLLLPGSHVCEADKVRDAALLYGIRMIRGKFSGPELSVGLVLMIFRFIIH